MGDLDNYYDNYIRYIPKGLFVRIAARLLKIITFCVSGVSTCLLEIIVVFPSNSL